MIKKILLALLLLSSIAAPVGIYFGNSQDHSKAGTHSNPKQKIKKENLNPGKARNAHKTQPWRRVTKFIPSNNFTPGKPKGMGAFRDAVILLTPSRHHGSYFKYNFTGQDKTYTGTSIKGGHLVSNDHKFKETDYGIITVNAENLDKVKATTYITWQKNSTAGMKYNKAAMIKFKKQVLAKEVLATSVTFSIRAHGLATCPALDFYIDYKSTGKGTSNDYKLGTYGIYSMNAKADEFFTSWLFFMILTEVVIVVVALIAWLIPPTIAYLPTFLNGVEMILGAVVFAVGSYMFSQLVATLPILTFLHSLGLNPHDRHNQSHHPDSSIQTYFGSMKKSNKNNDTQFGGDILNYEKHRNSGDPDGLGNSYNDFRMQLLSQSTAVLFGHIPLPNVGCD